MSKFQHCLVFLSILLCTTTLAATTTTLNGQQTITTTTLPASVVTQEITLLSHYLHDTSQTVILGSIAIFFFVAFVGFLGISVFLFENHYQHDAQVQRSRHRSSLQRLHSNSTTHQQLPSGDVPHTLYQTL
jgi:hypothetical protein